MKHNKILSTVFSLVAVYLIFLPSAALAGAIGGYVRIHNGAPVKIGYEVYDQESADPWYCPPYFNPTSMAQDPVPPGYTPTVIAINTDCHVRLKVCAIDSSGKCEKQIQCVTSAGNMELQPNIHAAVEKAGSSYKCAMYHTD